MELSCAAMLARCAPAHQDSAATLNINISHSAAPDVSAFSMLKSTLGHAKDDSNALPTTYCYALHVTAPDLIINGTGGSSSTSCPYGPPGLGIIGGLYNAGDNTSDAKYKPLNVPIGTNRRVDLIGISKSNLGLAAGDDCSLVDLSAKVVSTSTNGNNVRFYSGSTVIAGQDDGTTLQEGKFVMYIIETSLIADPSGVPINAGSNTVDLSPTPLNIVSSGTDLGYPYSCDSELSYVALNPTLYTLQSGVNQNGQTYTNTVLNDKFIKGQSNPAQIPISGALAFPNGTGSTGYAVRIEWISYTPGTNTVSSVFAYGEDTPCTTTTGNCMVTPYTPAPVFMAGVWNGNINLSPFASQNGPFSIKISLVPQGTPADTAASLNANNNSNNNDGGLYVTLEEATFGVQMTAMPDSNTQSFTLNCEPLSTLTLDFSSAQAWTPQDPSWTLTTAYQYTNTCPQSGVLPTNVSATTYSSGSVAYTELLPSSEGGGTSTNYNGISF